MPITIFVLALVVLLHYSLFLCKKDLYARKAWKRIKYITVQFHRRFKVDVLSNFE